MCGTRWHQRDTVLVIVSQDNAKRATLKKIDGKDGIVKYADGGDRDVVALRVSFLCDVLRILCVFCVWMYLVNCA